VRAREDLLVVVAAVIERLVERVKRDVPGIAPASSRRAVMAPGSVRVFARKRLESVCRMRPRIVEDDRDTVAGTV
jgi:hypothetical protein